MMVGRRSGLGGKREGSGKSWVMKRKKASASTEDGKSSFGDKAKPRARFDSCGNGSQWRRVYTKKNV